MVKVVLDRNGYALYFSRAPMPWQRGQFSYELQLEQSLQGTYYRHCGLYAYHAGFLKDYLSWGCGPLEQVECLEQLRVLWHGERVYVLVVDEGELPLDVNTEEDLERVRALMRKKDAVKMAPDFRSRAHKFRYLFFLIPRILCRCMDALWRGFLLVLLSSQECFAAQVLDESVPAPRCSRYPLLVLCFLLVGAGDDVGLALHCRWGAH